MFRSHGSDIILRRANLASQPDKGIINIANFSVRVQLVSRPLYLMEPGRKFGFGIYCFILNFAKKVYLAREPILHFQS